MRIPQDMFNKIITTMMLLYAMIMFTLSWIYNKPLDLTSYSVLVAPLVTHVTHLISNKFEDKHG